jgi:DNA polymerase III psi subunit
LNQAALPYLFQEDLYRTQQKVLVVVSKAWDEYSAEDTLLLSRILGSVKLNLGSVQIVTQDTLSLTSLKSYSPSKILVFGSAGSGINLYEPTQVQGFSLLKADDLQQLDEPKKKSLWNALKNMFGL